jgi:hypothetical protein
MDSFVTRFVILTAAAVVVGTTCAIATPYSFSDHPSQDGRCIGDKGVGEIDRSENSCLAQIGELARPTLQLNLKNGKTKIYLNEAAKCQSDTADGCVKYQLTGYFPEHNIILVEVDYWEGVSWLLVWADTGDSSAIVSPPHYSPDKRWLASVASAEGPSGPPSGVDIVPSRPASALKEWHYRIPDDGQWLYQFAGWEGNTRVKLLASSLGAPQRNATTSIERRNNEWHFEEPP